MSQAHSTIADPYIHEPKGIAASAVNKVYVANGSGSGTWQKIASGQIDTTSVFNVNKSKLVFRYTDVSSASDQFLILPEACTITKISAVSQAAINTAVTIMTFKNNAGGSMGTITTGSTDAAKTTYSLTPSVNNTFAAGEVLTLSGDGGSTGTADWVLVIDITLTA